MIFTVTFCFCFILLIGTRNILSQFLFLLAVHVMNRVKKLCEKGE